VKHPCLASRKHQSERDSGDTEAPLEHYFTPKVAQVARPKALYIHPRQFSRFCTLPHFDDFDFTLAAITPLIPSHHHTIISPFMHCIHAPCAILRALHAPIILTEFLSILHYHIFSLASVFIHIPLTSYQFPLNQPSMRDLRVCLTYNFAPCTFTLSLTSRFHFKVAFFAFSAIALILSLQPHSITIPLGLGTYLALIRRLYDTFTYYSRLISPPLSISR
jgi:hypothetical protein